MLWINSIIQDQNLLSVLNIIFNSSTGLILSFISSLTSYEHIRQFNQRKIKFKKILPTIDSKSTNDIENISTEFIHGIAEDYYGICGVFISKFNKKAY